MNKLTIFNYEGNTVRTVMKDGNPWWVLKDVCSVLDIGNSRDVMARLDSDEKESILSTPLEENRKYLLSMKVVFIA